MASAQATMITETILDMQRVLAQLENSSESDEPYLQPSNRGNKLKRKAHQISGTTTAKKTGRELYTTNIKHAGYHRDIIRRNPKRYDEDGDELGPEDVDEEADTRAEEENPYSGIHLETLLAPLTSASDLVKHPSLSAPYLSSVLSDMADQACDTIHRERKTLGNAKLLLKKLRGDEIWIPTEAMNVAIDEEIFDAERVFSKIVAETSITGSNAKSGHVTASASVNGDAMSRAASASTIGIAADSAPVLSGTLQQRDPVKEATVTLAPEKPKIENSTDDMLGRALDAKTTTNDTTSSDQLDADQRDTADTGKVSKDEVLDTIGNEMTKEVNNGSNDNLQSSDASKTAGKSKTSKEDEDATMTDAPANTDPDETAETNANSHNDVEAVDEDVDEAQPEPRRMRTRAQAQAASDPSASSHTASPEAPFVAPPIHPLFLLPESAKPDPDFGLPPPEAEETRRMLMAYVQKQEEVCRGAEKLYQNLLRANRERITVLRWSKAEEHVGEMSDGEDWCDKEEWGLDEDLKKGEGDEKDEGDATTAKKTRGRRA